MKTTHLLILGVAAVGLLMYFNTGAYMVGMPSTCHNSDGGDDPYTPGWTQGPNGYNTGWDNALMDKCANTSGANPDTYGEHLWEAVCVQAQWAQDQKLPNSGWSSAYIKHDCTCIQPTLSTPAYCQTASATTTTTTPDDPDPTPSPEDLPTETEDWLMPAFFGGMVLVLGYMFLGRKTS